MRSFSCWRATRVRARPLSPLLGAPALYTLILSAASTWGTPPPPAPSIRSRRARCASAALRLCPLSGELAGGSSPDATLHAPHLGDDSGRGLLWWSPVFR